MFEQSLRAGAVNPRSVHLGIFARPPVQFLGCLLIAVLLPYLVRLYMVDAGDGLVQLNQTLVISAVAVLLGSWLLHSVNNFPGAEASAYIVPSLSVSFALLVFVVTVGRIEYARAPLIAGYVLSIMWYYSIHVMLQRHHVRRIAYLPFGAVDILPSVRQVQWIPIVSLDAPFPRVDAIAADLRVDLPDEWDRRLSDYALAGIPVFHMKHVLESLTGRVELEHLSENAFGSLVPLSSFMSFKRIVDWLTALVAGIVLLPALLAVAVAVRTSSAGPALFRQRRVGYQGRSFTVYKFRTMRVHSIDGCRDAAMTRPGDDRVTRLGRFMRSSRIDELPQIINILKGEMSWIGPRPEAEILSKWYQAEIPFYRYRHVVRPGIAGWAQVSQGHVSEIDEVKSKLHYDFFYIKHFSPWIDLLIIVRTIRTVLTGFGSR